MLQLTGREKLFYWLLRAIFFILGHMPREWGVNLGNMIGQIWFEKDKRHRDVALSNLAIAYGNEKTPEEMEKIALSVFQNISQVPFEVAWSLTLTHKNFLKHFEIMGLYHLKNALKKNNGVIAITAHAGNWEFLPAVLSLSGIPLNVVYRPLTFKPLDKYLGEYRNRFGVKLIAKKKSMRKILKTLMNKEVAGIVFDQDSGRTAGVFVDFLGKKACTSKGLALMAMKTKSPVVPVFIARTGNKYRVLIEEEIPVIETGNKEQDIEINTLQYNQAIEKFVRQYPDQWFWVHNRFKNQPFPETDQCSSEND